MWQGFLWWLLKRSHVARWFFTSLVAEMLFDLERADIDGQAIKAKWLARLRVYWPET
mgnify:CR=1 FL=1